MNAERSDPIPTTILRTPAAIVIAAFAVGLTFGALASPDPRGTFSLTGYWLALFICVPFLLPSAWFRHGSSGAFLRNWLIAAASVATVRLALRSAGSWPYRPFGLWVAMAALDAIIGGTLWLAVFALVRRMRAA